MVKQILPKAGEAILELFNKLGGNMNNVLGSRSNITFLGKGKNPEGFIDSDINVEAIGFLGKNKILEELESSIGYLTAGKLNDVQANKLLENMQKVDDVFNPKQVANITDLATGTRNLDQEGLASLRSRVDDIDLPEGVALEDTILPRGVGVQRVPADDIDLPPLGSRGEADDIAAPFQDAETTIKNLEKQDPELAAQFKAMMIGGNQGGTPAKRATAREFLVEALKKENPNQSGLSDVIDEVDVKYITEGGGGIGGDPLLLVEKYFGPRIRDLVPEGASSEEIVIFTNRVLNNVVDANGLRPTDPNFDRLTATFIDETQTFADGGRAGFFLGGLGRLGKTGYQAIRKYGIEAEDITNLFKSLATDKSLVGKEKTEYFKMLNQVLKNPDDYPDGVKEILKRLGKPIDFAEGGRVGFFKGALASGENISPGTDVKGNVRDDNPFTDDGGSDNRPDPVVTINRVVDNVELPNDVRIPTAVGLEALLADKGKFRAVFDAEEAVKDLDLGSGGVFSYDGSLGPIDVNAMANLSGDKSLNLGYQTKGGTNLGFETDLDDNTMFKLSRTFAKGGLAKILEV